nr:DUF2924 domain-containing protein [Paracoccaceae bacterium]
GLADMTIGDLKLTWREAWGVSPPSGARRRLLMLGIAWKWQAQVHGGHTKVVERRLAKLEAAVKQGGVPSGDAAAKSAPRRLMPGARILRVWKTERHEVHVTETGYLWRGKPYRSLSVIAREITGSQRNGPAFFGLRDGGAP